MVRPGHIKQAVTAVYLLNKRNGVSRSAVDLFLGVQSGGGYGDALQKAVAEGFLKCKHNRFFPRSSGLPDVPKITVASVSKTHRGRSGPTPMRMNNVAAMTARRTRRRPRGQRQDATVEEDRGRRRHGSRRRRRRRESRAAGMIREEEINNQEVTEEGRHSRRRRLYSVPEEGIVIPMEEEPKKTEVEPMKHGSQHVYGQSGPESQMTNPTPSSKPSSSSSLPPLKKDASSVIHPSSRESSKLLL